MNMEPSVEDCLLWLRGALIYLVDKKIPKRHDHLCGTALHWVTVAVGELDAVPPLSNDVPDLRQRTPNAELVLTTCLGLSSDEVSLWKGIGQRRPKLPPTRQAQLSFIRVLRDVLKWVSEREPRNQNVTDALRAIYAIIGEMLFENQLDIPLPE